MEAATKYLHKKVNVWWESDEAWYPGIIDNYHPSQGWHVQYDDGEREWVNETTFGELVKFVEEEEEEYVEYGGGDAEEDDDYHSHDSDELEVVSGTNAFRHLHSPPLGSPDAKNTSRGISFQEDNKAFDERLGLGLGKVPIPAEAKGYVNDSIDHEVSFKDQEMEPVEAKGDVQIPPGGMVLFGNIMGASNLPAVEEGEMDGQCFFRVLYVEGGTKSTMFRCKTPIYSSTVTENLQFPLWVDGIFRFEMILPEDAYIGTDGLGVRLQGQVLVAIYRVRGQGGNEFVGQATFDLGDLARNGTIEIHQPGVESRSLSGSFPLIDRLEKWVGNYAEIRVDLEMAWRPDTVLLNNAVAPPAPLMSRAGGTGTGGHNASQTGGRSRVGDPSVAGRSSARSKPTVAPSKAPRPTSAAAAKAASNNARRNWTEKKRIEMENKALTNRLMASGPKSKVNNLAALYAPPPPPPMVAEAKSTIAGSAAGSKGAASLENVVDIWTKLKKDVGDLEADNNALKANLSKLKILTKKLELGNDRIKKRVGPAALSSGVSVNAELISKYLPPSSSSSVMSHDKRRKQTAAEEEEDLDAIQDNELKEIVMEHQALQQLRRGLIERIHKAKKTGVNAVATAKQGQSDAAALITRVAILAPYTSTAPPGTAPSTEEQQLKSLFERLKNVQLDFQCTEASKEHNFHVGPLIDAIHEDRAVLQALKKKLNVVKGQLTSMQHARDDAEDQRRSMTDAGEQTAKLTRRLLELQRQLATLRAQQHLESLNEGVVAIEREVNRRK